MPAHLDNMYVVDIFVDHLLVIMFIIIVYKLKYIITSGMYHKRKKNWR